MAGCDSVDQLYKSVFLAAKKLGVGQALADDMARMVDDDMRKQLGGRIFYWPAKSVDREKRDDDMLADYLDKISVPELMNKYGVSRATVYRVVGKV